MRVFTMLQDELDGESDIGVLRATAKQMLRSGKLLYKKHVKRSKREENARRRMKKSGLSPKDATAHEIKTLVAFMDDAVDSKDVSEAAKKSLGRGKKQRMEKFFSLAHRLYAGRLWKKIETDVLKRRALNARKGAKLVDDSKLNYSAFTAMRKELGEHGTKEKRVTGQTVIPSASSVQRVNADLDAYVAQKGLMCAGEGEMWHADYGKIMPSTFEIYGYQGAYDASPNSGAWRRPGSDPDAPIPMMIGCAADELPCETGVGGTGLMAMAIHHCDPRLNKNVRESPQMDEHVQPVVLYPTKQRKRKLDEKARAATAYATARSEGVDDDASDDDDAAEHDDDFEGMYQAEPNEEGDACTVLAAGKLKTKRDEVGKNLGPMVETLLAEEERRKDSSMPICCCFTLDKVGQYEFGPFRCATVGYHLCNFCPCARSMAGHGQPGGCRRCREAGTEATCTHWDMATPATKQYSEDREKALAERVGTMPDEVLPFWRNKAEATEIARKLEIKLRSGAKLETIESAIRAKCDCLTVRGADVPSNKRHVNRAPDTAVLRDARQWAKASGREEPPKPTTPEAWKQLRDTHRVLLGDAERLLHVRQVLKFWELLSPHDRGRLVSRDGHLLDVTKIIDCALHLTLRVVIHTLSLLYKIPLHAQSGLLAAEIGSRLDRATAAIQTGLDSASFAHRKAEGSDAAAWKAGTTKLRVFSMPAKRAKEIVRTSLICNSNHQIITVKHANSAGGETTRIVDVGDGTPTINVSLLERVAEELLPDDARLPKVKLFLQELIFVLHIVNTKSWETDPSMPATFQGHADAMGRLMVEIWGPESITPYFHDIIAGHLGQVDGN